MRATLLSKVTLLVVAFLGRSFACSCTPAASAPACERVASTEVVFLGIVLAAEPDPRVPTASDLRIYRFQVERAYKGLDNGAVQVIVNPDNFTTCQTSYAVGKRYLVFASRLARTRELISGVCHNSLLANFAREDVQFLEAYRLNQAANLVYGRVLQWVTSIGRPRREEDAPVAGSHVLLSNGSREWTQRATTAGDFRFENIPAGSYSLSANLEPYTANPPALRIEVPAAGCVERFPLLEARARVSGTLVDESGNPAPRKRVELLRRNQSGAWYSTYQFWKQTDEWGRFTFDGLPDGDYLLGYDIWSDKPSQYSPYPTIYFPGVLNRAGATVLHLSPNQTMRDLRIALGKPHTPRKIHVEVVWPDGRVPARNLLQLSDGATLIKNVGGSFGNPRRTPPAHNGIVDFDGYAERSYELNVRYWIDDLGGPVPHDQQRIARSETVRLPPGKGPTSVKIVLTKTLLAEEDR